MHTIQYEEGLTVARRIRASRYLGTYSRLTSPHFHLHHELTSTQYFQSLIECSAKHNRGVNEVFYEAARVSLTTKAKGAGAYGGGGGTSCVIC